jgi:hypothetical protein
MLTSCFLFLAFTTCYGRNYEHAMTHNIHKNDQVTYNGKIVALTSSAIQINVYGPGCEGLLKFNRDTWRTQVTYAVGDVISFILSGECSDEKSVLTVESKKVNP